jgi:hypothetical protein
MTKQEIADARHRANEDDGPLDELGIARRESDKSFVRTFLGTPEARESFGAYWRDRCARIANAAVPAMHEAGLGSLADAGWRYIVGGTDPQPDMNTIFIEPEQGWRLVVRRLDEGEWVGWAAHRRPGSFPRSWCDEQRRATADEAALDAARSMLQNKSYAP